MLIAETGLVWVTLGWFDDEWRATGRMLADAVVHFASFELSLPLLDDSLEFQTLIPIMCYPPCQK